MGTLAEFQNSALAASAEKWKVLLDPLDGGQLGTADAKTIVVKASNLVYVSGLLTQRTKLGGHTHVLAYRCTQIRASRTRTCKAHTYMRTHAHAHIHTHTHTHVHMR